VAIRTFVSAIMFHYKLRTKDHVVESGCPKGIHGCKLSLKINDQCLYVSNLMLKLIFHIGWFNFIFYTIFLITLFLQSTNIIDDQIIEYLCGL
jgi:hypothetical protein